MAFYDPGSSITAIDVTTARRIGIRFESESHTINSGGIKCLGVAIVKLTIGETTILNKVYVIDYCNLREKVLIGLNVIRDFGLTHNQKFEITNFDQSFVIKTSLSDNVNEKVNLAELNMVLNGLSDEETKVDEIERAINHIVVNDVTEYELAINDELSEETKGFTESDEEV